MKNYRLWLLLVVAVAAAGCSAAKRHLTADQYFAEANKSFRDGAFALAIQDFHDLLDEYPFGHYNEEAELKIAHAQYLSGNYPEAIVALTDFQRRHPTSAYLPFVGYCLGMCYAQQMSTIDRDQTTAQNASNYFQTVIQQYPDSAFTELAREELGRCRQNLAAHELYIAAFYAQRANEKAAEIRLLSLASRYEETEASADALLRLAKLYRHQQRADYAVLAYHALTQSQPRTPQAEVARQALKRLSKDGSEPGSPLDTLLAFNGRHRTTETFETVQVPGLEPHGAHHPSSALPAMVPPVDPFGRGGAMPYGY